MTDMTENFICSKCNKIIKNGQICFYVKRKIFCSKCYIQDVKENEQLKQQLEEKNIRIEELEGQFAYECECNKQLVELQKQLAEKDKEINSLIVDYEKRISQEQELMSNMEHRLAEKQKTIDEINKEFVQAVHDWKALCKKKDKEIEMLKHTLNLYNLRHKGSVLPNVNQLAIQELEKVKNFVDGRTYCADYINKRIQDLKGE